jgi:hypothetical protein
MPEDLSRFCCLNEHCPDHGRRGAGNLTVCARYGKDGRRRMLYCRSCKARFSERKGTPLFDSRLPPAKVLHRFVVPAVDLLAVLAFVGKKRRLLLLTHGCDIDVIGWVKTHRL